MAQAQQEQTATHEAIAAELGAAPENVDEALAQSEAEAAAALDTVIPGFAAASTGASQQNLVHAKQNELQAQVDLAKAHVAAVPGLAGKAKALGQASSAYEHAVRDAAANYENYELAKASLVAQGASEVSATGLNGEGDFTVTVNLPEDQSVTYRANDKGQIIADYSESGKAAAAEIKGLNQFQAAVQGMYENTQAFAKGGAVTQAQAKLDAALAKVQDAEGTTRPDTPTDPEDGDETDSPDELAAAQNESAAYQVAAIGSDGQIEVNGVKTTSQAFETQLDTSLMPLSAQVVATEKAVEDFQNQAEQFFQYAAWRQELNDAQDTVDSAREDLESLLDEEDMVLHGEDETAATEGNDLFIFGSHLADAEIFDFGASGADQIYFGHEMSFVAVDEQTQIGTSAVGELDVLEIFAQQTEDGVTLYVENESFDGSSVHGLQGMAELQLVGVSLDSLQFNNGFLSNTVVAVDTDAIA